MLHALNELDAGLVAALDAEREHRAGAERQILLRQRAERTGCQPRVGNPGDARMSGKEFRHCVRVGDVPLHAEGKRFDAHERQVRVHRRERGAEIAQRDGARLGGEGEIAEILVEAQAVIRRLRFGQRREFFALFPVEFAGLHHHAAERVAVAAEEFRHRMDDDVGTPFDRAAEVGAGQRVVDDQRQAGRVRDRRDRFEVHHHAAGVGEAFDEDRLAARRQRPAEVLGVGRVDEAAVPAELGERLRKLRQRAAVQVARGDEFVARREQGKESNKLRGVAGGGGHGGASPSSAATRSSSTATVGLERRV